MAEAADAQQQQMDDGMPKPPGPVTINGKEYKPLADGKYDIIILGTGLKECILSGLLSVNGKYSENGCD